MTAPRRRNVHRLRTKLVVAILALLAAICASIGIIGHLAMNDYLNREIDSGLHSAASRAFGPQGPQPSSTPSAQDTQPNPFDTRGQRPGTLNAVFSNNEPKSSAVVQLDGSADSLSAEDLAKIAQIPSTGRVTEMTLSSGTYRLSASVETSTSGEKLVTGLSTAERDSTLNSLNLITISISVVGLIVIGLVGTIIVRRALRPLDELSAVAKTVASLPLDSGEAAIDVRIPAMAAEPGTEVGEVGVAFNNMLDHVTRAFAARHASETKVRQFVADASHELRTPLTSIRGYTELILLRETLSPTGTSALLRVDSESKRMSALVEDLLLLARLDEGQRGEPTDVDLTDMLMETMQDTKVAALDHRWSLTLPDEPVLVRAVEPELRQVLINLLSNAHKHTAAGTHVQVSLAAAQGMATLDIEDNGTGISKEFLEHIFTRFSRADPSRSGSEGNDGGTGSGSIGGRSRGGTNSSGLGLAIVEALVEANNGTVTVTSSPGMTRFTVTLPTA